MRLQLLTAASVALVAIAMPAHAEPVLSENFDAGFGVFTVESATIAITTARPGYMQWVGVIGSDAAADNPFIVFGSGSMSNGGSMFTHFQTRENTLYTLTFRAGAFGGDTTNLSYAVSGTTGSVELIANNDADATFKTYSFNFVGTGSPTTLSFWSSGPATNVDAILDDVSVTTAVPEPGTWALLMLGFGGLGYVVRRKRIPNDRVKLA